MQSAINSIIRQATRKKNDRLKVITAVTHEAFEENLSKTNCEFYAVQGKDIKPWTTAYRQIPENYHILPEGYLPDHISFDICLSQHKFGQFQILKPIASKLHIPLISLEHTLTMPFWDNKMKAQLRNMTGDINVFISDYSRKAWGFDEEAEVIHHGIDTDLFKPLKKQKVILSVVNDFVNRGPICGFPMWKKCVKDLPVKLFGNTPGLSKPASSVKELAEAYGSSLIFLNTSVISPIPTSLLEGMAAGCCPVSTSNCMIPEIIQHGKNGFLTNDDAEMRKYLELLLNDEELALRMGRAARQTILDNFGLDAFVNNWNLLFQRASNITFRG